MTRRSTGHRGTTLPRRTAVLAATLLGAAALVLSGCSAGAVTQTDTQVSSATGSSGTVGAIDLRAVTIDPGSVVVVPAGSTVTLAGTLVNNALGDDQLVSVSTPYANSVRVEGQTTVAGNSATRIVGSQPVPVGPPSATSPTASMRITLAGVTQVLHEGPTYPVTLSFARSGTITLPVPVQNTSPVPVS